MAVTEENRVHEPVSGTTVTSATTNASGLCTVTYITASSDDYYYRKRYGREKERKVTGNTQRVPFYRGLNKRPCHGSAPRA